MRGYAKEVFYQQQLSFRQKLPNPSDQEMSSYQIFCLILTSTAKINLDKIIQNTQQISHFLTCFDEASHHHNVASKLIGMLSTNQLTSS